MENGAWFARKKSLELEQRRCKMLLEKYWLIFLVPLCKQHDVNFSPKQELQYYQIAARCPKQ